MEKIARPKKKSTKKQRRLEAAATSSKGSELVVESALPVRAQKSGKKSKDPSVANIEMEKIARPKKKSTKKQTRLEAAATSSKGSELVVESALPVRAKKSGKKSKDTASKRIVVTALAEAPADLFSKAGWKNAVKLEHEKFETAKTQTKALKAAKVATPAESADEGEAVDTELDDIKDMIVANVGTVSRKRKVARRQDRGSDVLDAIVPSKVRCCEDLVRTSASTMGAKAFLKAHEITVPANCPAPFETFADAATVLGDSLTKTLTSQGFLAPTPIQAQAWPIALEGRDMVSVAKTGSGKTCGFLVPALVRLRERGPAPTPKEITYYQSEPSRPSTLILAPTRELAQQITAEAEKFVGTAGRCAGFKVVSIYGGVPKGDQVRALKLGADILIATPGRLIDFAQAKPEKDIRACVDLCNVNYLVLDEADRMLDMGFEADIRKIVSWCKPSGTHAEGGGASGAKAGTKRQTLFFTATWPKAVQRTAASLTSRDAVQVRIGQDADKLTANKSVTQIVSVIPHDAKLPKLGEILANELKAGETAIVFAATKGGCDYLERHFTTKYPTYWCGAIHSGREQWERDESLTKFRDLTAGTSQQRGVLFATDVAARGLDIPGVALVVVYDFSTGQGLSGVESYVHRIGRTGRAGLQGRAFTFFMPGETNARDFVELLRGANQQVPEKLAALGEADRGKGKGGKGKGKAKGGKGGGKGGKSGKAGKGGKGW